MRPPKAKMLSRNLCYGSFFVFAVKKHRLHRKFAAKIVFLHRKHDFDYGNLHLATPAMAEFHLEY